MELQTGADLNLSQLRFQVLTVLIREVGKDFKVEASKAEIDTRREGILEQVVEKLDYLKHLLAQELLHKILTFTLKQ